MICLGFLILCSYLARCLRLVSESKLQRNNGVSIALDASFKVWLINESNENHTIASGELFGFGIGAYQEVSSGHLVSPLVQYVSILQWCPFPAHPVSTVGNSAVDLIPWSVGTCSGWACAVLTKRRSWLFPRSCVTSQRSGGPQRPVFWITTWSLFARRGIVQKPLKKMIPTALHNMSVSNNMSTCSCQDGAKPGDKIPRQFRYLVSMRAKVNAFKPTELMRMRTCTNFVRHTFVQLSKSSMPCLALKTLHVFGRCGFWETYQLNDFAWKAQWSLSSICQCFHSVLPTHIFHSQAKIGEGMPASEGPAWRWSKALRSAAKDLVKQLF